MSREVYRWSCGCGHTGTGETAAQRHAQACTLMGPPEAVERRRTTQPELDRAALHPHPRRLGPRHLRRRRTLRLGDTVTDYPRICVHVAAVADACGVAADEILSPSRKHNVCRARHLLYWLMRYDGLSYPRIGALLERDHSTVMHGVNRVDSDRALLWLAWALVPREVAA